MTVVGEVWREAIFETKAGASLWGVLDLAGGFQADAFVNRVQIDRILLPEERLRGRERVLIDIDPVRAAQEGLRPEVEDGDVVRVLEISDERGNRTTIRGDVFRPGEYEFRSGMSLWDLIERADGLLPDTAQTRWSPAGESFPLLDQDAVFVRRHPGYVEVSTVEGQVLFPGGYAMISRDESVSSIIGRAGGLRSAAYVLGACLMRGDVAVALDLSGALQRPGWGA